MPTLGDLITVLKKLLKLHKNLFELAVKKTEYIKVGDMDSLNQILKEEQFLVSEINKFENLRIQITQKVCPGIENPTVKDCIEIFSGEEKELLIEVAHSLSETALDLKERNFLNQQLIYQSLQFVNFSLSLLSPQPESINYGPPAKRDVGDIHLRGIFNSEA